MVQDSLLRGKGRGNMGANKVACDFPNNASNGGNLVPESHSPFILPPDPPTESSIRPRISRKGWPYLKGLRLQLQCQFSLKLPSNF